MERAVKEAVRPWERFQEGLGEDEIQMGWKEKVGKGEAGRVDPLISKPCGRPLFIFLVGFTGYSDR